MTTERSDLFHYLNQPFLVNFHESNPFRFLFFLFSPFFFETGLFTTCIGTLSKQHIASTSIIISFFFLTRFFSSFFRSSLSSCFREIISYLSAYLYLYIHVCIVCERVCMYARACDATSEKLVTNRSSYPKRISRTWLSLSHTWPVLKWTVKVKNIEFISQLF